MLERKAPVQRIEDTEYLMSLKCKNQPNRIHHIPIRPKYIRPLPKYQRMINQTYNDIVTPELLAGAIENNEYEGFREDYHVLHCLIRKYKPISLLEIGTNMGTGTNIICNAGKNWLMQVYSLDLPTALAHVSLQHPISEGKGDRVGSNCQFHYTQLRGDSMEFDFSQYPCEAYYVDGEHSEQNVRHETVQILNQSPKLIIYHDTDISEVYNGIISAFKLHDESIKYYLYRVQNTRISYAIKRNLEAN